MSPILDILTTSSTVTRTGAPSKTETPLPMCFNIPQYA